MAIWKVAIVLLLLLSLTLVVDVDSDARKNWERRGLKTGTRIADKMMPGRNRRNALEEMSQKR